MISISSELAEVVEKKVSNAELISKNMKMNLKMRIVFLLTVVITVILLCLAYIIKKSISKRIGKSKPQSFFNKRYSLLILNQVEKVLEKIRKDASSNDFILEKVNLINDINLRKKMDKEIALENLRQSYQSFLSELTTIHKEKLIEEWSNFEKDYNNFVNENMIRILTYIQNIIIKNIETFEFISLCEAFNETINEEFLVFKNAFTELYNKVVANVNNKTDDKKLEQALMDFNKSLSEFSGSSYKNYKGSLDPNSEDFKNTFNQFKSNLNVNQEWFHEKIQKFKDAFSSSFTYNEDINFILIKKELEKSFSDTNLKTSLLRVEIWNKITFKIKKIQFLIQNKLRMLLFYSFPFKITAIRQLSTVLNNIENLLTTLEIFILLPSIITIIIFLFSVVRIKEETKHYKLLISITVINTIINLIQVIHKLVSILSNYVPSLALFIYKINLKRNLYPWIIFHHLCLNLCSICVFVLMFFICNVIGLPFLLFILQKDIGEKNTYNKRFLFALLVICLFLGFCSVIFFIVLGTKAIFKYYANLV